ncbi:CpaF family protein [Brevibacillus borstelensis]|uniref:CpaF family protein n=1 Tax=Brevibacillus borstelensis TaxID=45462 RepID=UPI002E216695|nr:CpaF family protein [Brevibacillus borstelensis]
MRVEEAIRQKKAGATGEGPAEGRAQENVQLPELKQAVRERIIEQNKKDQQLLSQPELLRQVIWKVLEEESESRFGHALLTLEEKRTMVEEIVQQLVGYGIIDPLVKNEQITEIMINGIERIFIEEKGRMRRAMTEKGAPLQFESESELLHLIEKIVAPINRKVDESDPIVDARLADGSRVNVVIRPISLSGPIVTIRKFPENPYTMQELVELGALSPQIAEWLEKLICARYNIVVSGGTGSGKTTFLNALSMFIPQTERVITVEDAAELKVTHIENLVRLETRPPNVEGKGAIAIRDLVRTALRMRPDRIVVGEVRGGEAVDMLQAMNTGHDGSLTTGHANSARDMLSRLETMVLMSGLELPLPAIRRQIASAVEIIVHLGRLRDGSRKVLQISEIRDYVDGEIECVDLFRWRMEGMDEDGRLRGALVPTGEPVMQMEKWLSRGYGETMFEAEELRC